MMKDRNEWQHHSTSETRMQDLSHTIAILDNIPWSAEFLFWLSTLEASNTPLFPPHSRCINTSAKRLGRVSEFGTKTPENTAGSALTPWQQPTCCTIPAGPLLPAWPGVQHFQHPPLWCFPLWRISCFGNGAISHKLCAHCPHLTVITTLLFPSPQLVGSPQLLGAPERAPKPATI